VVPDSKRKTVRLKKSWNFRIKGRERKIKTRRKKRRKKGEKRDAKRKGKRG
jgi:hypothetical protein